MLPGCFRPVTAKAMIFISWIRMIVDCVTFYYSVLIILCQNKLKYLNSFLYTV